MEELTEEEHKSNLVAEEHFKVRFLKGFKKNRGGFVKRVEEFVMPSFKLSNNQIEEIPNLIGYANACIRYTLRISAKSVPSNISLPSSIHQLMLLRYLDASGLPITSLPKSLHKLQNMQTLILSNCALETLPNNIGSLLNLCYLDLSGNSSLNKLPVSFGELSALWFLNLSACSKFYELPESIGNLISLRHLDMSGCNVLQKLPDKFGTLPNLLLLNLSSCSKLVKQPDSINIKSLEHLNLSSCHQLQGLPNNFGNLENLMFLNLSDYYNAHMLPESFCRLKHLKDLDLSDYHDLKEIPKCFGNLSELHSLNLTSCSKLQSLPESFGGMSKLKRLDLSYCIRLENLPSSFHSLKLQVLYMLNLHELPEGISNMTSLIKFEVHSVKGWDIDFFGTPSILRLPYRVVERSVHEVHEVGYWPHSSIVSIGKLACQHLRINHLEKVKHSEDVERAKLRDNADLQKLCLSWGHEDMTENKRDAEVLENLIPPRTLEGFTLRGYMGTNLPKWMLEISSYLPYLTSIKLMNLACDVVPQLGMLPNLRLLLIILIPNITKIRKEFYGEKGACKRLRVIQLYGLKNMEECWTTRSGEEGDDFLIPNLHMLDIWDCPKLKFLSYPPKSMYWDLTDGDEVLPPMHEFGRLSSSTLPFEAKIRSKSFTTDKWDRLQHLATLEELSVTSFHSSLASFPEATPCFPSLKRLHLMLPSLEILPERLGQLITLEKIIIRGSPNLTSLPQSIRNLTALKRLEIGS
ncbi:leucine-rich repeat protein SHOC-2-like [Panicum virgatum]|uniref:leucine-rich repeat protein SHOC-2-like n=1 Tax=Panicum virgatum TaxID=38727 RepID=UPI0019D5CB87|nr:leucine-rich repeat protein SHOC-2-like [Panicum virgatum]